MELRGQWDTIISDWIRLCFNFFKKLKLHTKLPPETIK